MNNITLSLLAIAIAVFIVTVGVLLSRGKSKQREEALAAYCSANNYRFSVTKEAATRRITIENDNWRIENGWRISGNSALPGSSDSQRETVFVCGVENPMRKTFALMISGGSSNLNAVPDWVRNMAITQLRSRLGLEMRGLSSVRTVQFQGGRSALLFETELTDADSALELLRRPLSAWRGQPPLYLECSPGKISVSLPGNAMDSPEQIDEIIHIGLALC